MEKDRQASALRADRRSARPGFYDLDIATGRASVDPEYARMLGYDPASFVLTPEVWLELIHPEDRERVQLVFAACLSGQQESYELEYRMRTSNGAWRWIASVGRIAGRGVSGHPLRLVGTHLDISHRVEDEQALRTAQEALRERTLALEAANERLREEIAERRRTEASLRESERRYQTLADLAPVGIYRNDATGAGVYVNRYWSQLTGRTLEQALNDDWQEAIHPEDREAVREAWTRAFRDGDCYQDLTFRYLRPDGSVIWAIAGVAAERRSDGEVIGYVGTVTDITERKRVEAALRESEARFRAMVDQAPLPIGLADRAGAIRYINAQFTETFGYTLADVPTVDVWFAHAYPDPQYRADITGQWASSIERAARNGTTAEFLEVRVRTKAGTDLVVDVFGVAMADTLMAVFSDQTERARVQAELQNLNATLEVRVQEEVARNRQKDHLLIQQSRFAAMGEMIGNIAHQWRQPINALGLLLANVRDAQTFGELTSDYLCQQIERGQRLIQQMSTTIEDFRNFFRPNREPQSFRLSEAVADALAIVDSAFDHRGIQVERSVRDDPLLSGFPNECAQVVLNLLANARDAIASRAVAPGRVEITVDSDRTAARLTVADNGGGIDPALLPRIFDPYFTTRDNGTGIGLYMSRMIIESSMNGRIEIANCGEGACATVTIPLVQPGAPDRRHTAGDGPSCAADPVA